MSALQLQSIIFQMDIKSHKRSYATQKASNYVKAGLTTMDVQTLNECFHSLQGIFFSNIRGNL